MVLMRGSFGSRPHSSRATEVSAVERFQPHRPRYPPRLAGLVLASAAREPRKLLAFVGSTVVGSTAAEGVIAVGPKLSGDTFYQQDTHLFSDLVTSGVTA